MAKAKKKTAKEASTTFHNIMAVLAKGDVVTVPKKKPVKKKA